VEEALEHPFLAQMHDPFDEPVSYPIPEFEFERADVSLEELRALIWQGSLSTTRNFRDEVGRRKWRGE
jgi:mitogen-activated protein kinase 1/3